MSDAGKIALKLDPVSDVLDDIAALGVHWTRNRENGRIPFSIRDAILMAAREAILLADSEQHQQEQRFAQLCWPESDAYAKGREDEREQLRADLAYACMVTEIPDSKYESLLIALKA